MSQVLKAQANLRDRKWRVDKDLTPAQNDQRKQKKDEFDKLKAAGAHVFFKGTDLYVRRAGGAVPAAEWQQRSPRAGRAGNNSYAAAAAGTSASAGAAAGPSTSADGATGTKGAVA